MADGSTQFWFTTYYFFLHFHKISKEHARLTQYSRNTVVYIGGVDLIRISGAKNRHRDQRSNFEGSRH